MSISKAFISAVMWVVLSYSATAAPGEWPAPIKNGFDLLLQGKAKDALHAWGEGSNWTNQQEFIKNSTMVLGVAPVSNGPLKDMEELASVSISPSITLYWFALIYEHGVRYLWFEVLTTDEKQIVTSMSRYEDVREMAESLALFSKIPGK